ncbi:MAG: hypothetical protein C4K49_12785 [Candidatus Thorarchaeota archaeon]|nr:MAG: hypothetical protein C4K49_12785 [Candidatus Thorarchaeota archaeon]
MGASKIDLLFVPELIIILITVAFMAPCLNDWKFVEGDETSRLKTNGVDQQALVETVQTESRSFFYENLGQVDCADVRFYGRIPGGVIGFADSKVYVWIDGVENGIVMSFDAARSVIPQGINRVSHNISYLLGNRGTFTGIRGFARVVYNDLWLGISLFYEATVDGAKYEFRVAPGGDPTDIRVRCNGTDSVVIGSTSLSLEKDGRTLTDEGLRSFQGTNAVESEFISLGYHVFGFRVGDYDKSRPLVLDPLLYSTYMGGTGSEHGYGIAVDGAGNAYITGVTDSLDFPTLNAYNSTFGGYKDAFVFKVSSAGNTLLYSTYVGGSGNDWARGIAVDNSGNAYVTGYTESTDFPTVNAYDSMFNGAVYDCFVFKLSSAGNSLLYSTYVGGSSWDRSYGIAVDSTGNAYITGETLSSDFPALNAYDSALGGYADCFVFKLSSGGNALLYSTYVGGNGQDGGSAIAVNSTGSAFVTGYTDSTDFPTVNAYNSTASETDDVFVFRLSSAGSMLYSTFVGGSDTDAGCAIAVDSTGNAYITGETLSSDFPTVNEYDSNHGNAYGGSGDVFVFKISSAGNTLLYSTFVGGGHHEYGCAIAVDSNGNAYVTGETFSSDFPTVNAYNSTFGGYKDAFVFKLSSAGNTLLFSTFVGGSDEEGGYGVAVVNTGDAYVTGYTVSWDFPTVKAYDGTLSGPSDCFVFKLTNATTTTTITTQDGAFSLLIVATGVGLGMAALMAVLVTLIRRSANRGPEALLVRRRPHGEPRQMHEL